MHIELKMQALCQFEVCSQCLKDFDRGENMNAVVYDDNEPAGWWCDACVAESKRAAFELVDKIG